MTDKEQAARRRAARLAAGDLCSENGCGNPRHGSDGLCKTHHNRATGNYVGTMVKDPDRERARLRLKTHRRKDWSRLTDITPEYEMELRAKAKRCPLCTAKLTDEPYLPNSKELDHIVPRGAGGTHTMGNVRITCRTCNLARPKDGRDYVGAVTLWAEDPDFVPAVRQPRTRPPRFCKCGTQMTGPRCLTCRPMAVRVSRGRPSYTPASEFTGQQQHDRAVRAAQMRAEGTSWWDIADQLGYGRESSAMLAAQKVADVATRPYKQRQPYAPATFTGGWFGPVVTTIPLCVDCGDPATKGERCLECWTEVNERDCA